jgi:hypothetical protein
MKKRSCVWLALLALVLQPCLAQTNLRPTAEHVDELRIKVAFLFNFAKFTAWPPKEPSPESSRNFCVGVFGDESLLETLRKLVAGRTVRGLPVVAVDVQKPNDLRACDLVFISAAERHHVPACLRALAGSPVLTVSDTGEFLSQGGMVELFLEGSRMRFSINRKAIESNGLRMSAELQDLASSR